MNKIIIIVLILIGLSILIFGVNTTKNDSPDTQEPTERNTQDISITPISHATAVITWDGAHIYTDPVGRLRLFEGQPTPDLVFLTDIHPDHLDTETLLSLVTPTTVIIAPQAVADMLPASLTERLVVMNNGDTIDQADFSVKAIPMYNLPESDTSYHVKGRGNGYVIEHNGTNLYIAGDTAGTPEMRALTDIDVALVPMNLPYTMSVEEAADAVLDFAPRTVYPYHYRGTDGLSDVEKFKELVNAQNPDIRVMLLDWYPEQ